MVDRNKTAGLIEQNPGYKLCDWFVGPKYKDFKTEIVSNPLSGLSRRDWEVTLQKATLKLAAYIEDRKRRPLVCGWMVQLDGQSGYTKTANKWQKLYGIKKGAKVTVAHIMALLFYTNYTVASYEFSASFRRAFWNETDGALKLRHSAFVHQARLLRELVEAFGCAMSECAVPVFYHGVNADLIFEGTNFFLHGPLSTTSGLLLFPLFLCSLHIHSVFTLHILQRLTLPTAHSRRRAASSLIFGTTKRANICLRLCYGVTLPRRESTFSSADFSSFTSSQSTKCVATKTMVRSFCR